MPLPTPQRRPGMIMRTLVVVHRYLGVAVGLLMLLWCLSGFVMMYQGYPKLTEPQRLTGLEPLRWRAPFPDVLPALSDDAQLSGFDIEMLAGRPVLRITEGGRRQRQFDLQTGAVMGDINTDTAVAVARAFGAGHDIAGSVRDSGPIGADQWSVENASRRGPVHHLRFDDAAGTELYVAARTGIAVQVTNRQERFWSWLGAIPHWIYPTVLRQNTALWIQVVIWTSLIGAFLTVFGVYIGIARLRRYRSGRWSPYRGWFYWHHILGLVFGVLTLTWVASGMFTVNPWGYLESPAGATERMRVAGTIRGADLKHFLAAAPTVTNGQIVQLKAAPLDGHLFVMATGKNGASSRINDDGIGQPLTEAELDQALRASGVKPLGSLARLTHEDTYYYSGYERPVSLPVYRAQLADSQQTVIYLDYHTGAVIDALDHVARQSRWLRTGLHDFDFSAGLRSRPIWDVVVLLLLAGVTGVCATGAWMSLQRIVRDVRRLDRRLRGH